MVESMGPRQSRAFAWLAGLAEFGGGLLLALGLFTPLASAAVIALTGPGAYALDTALGLEMEGPAWAGIAVVVGALAALAVVGAQRMGGRTAGEPRTA